MPTYGYRCTACGHEFERFQKMTDPPVKECETCQAPVKKILYPVGIAFKGDGFYVNDYAPTSKKAAVKADSGETAKSAEPAATPAATTETKTGGDTASTTPAAPSTTPATPAPAAAKPAS